MSKPSPEHNGPGATGHVGGVDVVRKAAVVLVLLGGLALLHRFVGIPTEVVDPRGLLALGFVVLAAHAIGELAEVFKLPHITGYLLAGLVLGPSAAQELGHLLPSGLLPAPFDHGVLNPAVIGQLAVLDILALPLICLTAGGELDLPAIRKGLRTILALLGGQVVVLLAVFGVFTWAISGAIPGLGLPALAGLSGMGLLAISGVLASLGLATSAAATIAIIVGSRAKGPMTNNVLSVVVLKDVTVVVMFAAFTALAGTYVGAGGGVSFGTSLLHIAQSVVMGVAVGGLIHLYLRFVNAELLIFLVALIFGVTWLTHIVHGEIALVFITAGFVIGNWSDRGDTLLHEVERLSLPVYVVFFTLAGARLHLDVILQMAWFAVALVLLRTGAVWLGTHLGAVVGKADVATRKYGWMGMISQAGLSISLASQLPILFPGELGEGLFALVLAGVAVHEVIGPALLQAGLSKAGETAEQRAKEATAAVPAATDTGAQETLPESPVSDPWAPAFHSSSPELIACVQELQLDLQAAVEGWTQEFAVGVAQDHVRWLAELRREFLREHRRLLSRVRAGSPDSELIVQSFDGVAKSWRGQVLARAAAPAIQAWDPMLLASRVDARVDGLPATLSVPLEASSTHVRDEPTWRKTRRWWLRTRTRMGAVQRSVGPRDLARYHLSGRGVGHLEGLAALGVETELGVIDGVADAYAVYTEAHTKLAMGAESGTLSGEEAERILLALREQVEERLQLAQESASRLVELSQARAAMVLGAALAQLKTELAITGTFELSSWSRRMGRAYAHRNRGIHAVTLGLAEARTALGARYQALSLELEVASLEVQVARDLAHEGAAVERLCSDLALKQSRSALARLAEADAAFRTGLAEAERCGALSERIREHNRPAQRQLREAQRLVRHLLDRLTEDVGVVPLRDALVAACAGLTETYEVPAQPLVRGAWTLGAAVPTTQRRLRELSLAYIETTVATELDERLASHLQGYTALLRVLGEVERVLAFNVDLSMAELEVHPDDPIGQESRGLLSEMLLGAVVRASARLEVQVNELEGAPSALRSELDTVLRQALERLRTVAAAGDGNDLRRLLVLGAVARGQALQKSSVLRQPLGELAKVLAHQGERALGPQRSEHVRAWMGLDRAEPATVGLTPPETVAMPQVYQRLFQPRGSGGGSQVVGRQTELQQARATLALGGERGILGLIGPAGTGISTIAAGVWDARTTGEPARIRLSGPVGLEEIDRWFQRGAQPTELSGLGWLFGLYPGGAAPLRHFVDRLLAPERTAPWVICSTVHIWRTACGLAPLAEAVSGVVEIGPLDRTRLQEALLARHQMSAYGLTFQAQGRGTEAAALGGLLNMPSRSPERRQRAWFEALHRESGGLMSDAMRLWLQSVTAVDTEAGVVHLGPVPRAPREALAALDLFELLALRQALRQGWLDPGLLQSAFCIPAVDAHARLAGLTDRGLLERRQGRYFVAHHLRRALVLALEERGLAA